MAAVQLRARLQPLQPLTPKYRHADMYRRARAASIDASRFPLLAAHVADKGFLPDLAIDTPTRRLKNARPTVRRLRHLADCYGELSMFTLDLSHLNGLDHYSRALAVEAHSTVRQWLHAADLMGTWAVQRGRRGRTHAHVVTASSAPDAVGVRRSEVDDLEGLGAYLVTPSDARLRRFRPKDFTRWTLEGLTDMKHAGAEAYLAARAPLSERQRLPHLRSDNLPRGLSAIRVIDLPEGPSASSLVSSPTAAHAGLPAPSWGQE